MIQKSCHDKPFVLRNDSVSKHEQRSRSPFETAFVGLLRANGMWHDVTVRHDSHA